MSISVILSSRTAMPIQDEGLAVRSDEVSWNAVDEHRVGETGQSRETAGLGAYVRGRRGPAGRGQRVGADADAEHHGRVEDREQALARRADLARAYAGGGQLGEAVTVLRTPSLAVSRLCSPATR